MSETTTRHGVNTPGQRLEDAVRRNVSGPPVFDWIKPGAIDWERAARDALRQFRVCDRCAGDGEYDVNAPDGTFLFVDQCRECDEIGMVLRWNGDPE